MRAKHILSIFLVLVMLVSGCKEEPESTTNRLEPVTVGSKEAVEVSVESADEGSAKAGDEQGGEAKEYFAVFMEGKKVGHAIQSRSEADGKVRTSEDVSITINRMGVPVTIRMSETSIETPEGKPLGFETRQWMGTMEMKTTGRVDPNGLVRVSSSAMGTAGGQESTLMWPEGALMAEGLSLLTKEKGLKEGVEYTAKVFNAGVLQALDVHVRIGGEEEVNLLGRIVKLRETTATMTLPMAGEIVSTSYVDEENRAQKTLVPLAGMQIEMIACAKEFALGKNDVFEVINRMFVKTPQPIPDADKASSIAYTLSPIDNAKFNIPATDSQEVSVAGDGTVTLTVGASSMPVGGVFPYTGDEEAVVEATRPNRFLQSDDEKVVELARKAVGRTKDAGEAARRIEAFVAEYIDEKDLSVGYASASEVAASKQGDCTEHAVLAAAMCRAVGIPAQLVTGIAYVEDWRGLQGFGGHAWVQVYIGRNTGKWVGIDPAFKGTGRYGCGPGHIALAVGSGEPADFFNLATTLGKFKIDKVEVEK